jgi:hypothetical protein
MKRARRKSSALNHEPPPFRTGTAEAAHAITELAKDEVEVCT